MLWEKIKRRDLPEIEGRRERDKAKRERKREEEIK